MTKKNTLQDIMDIGLSLIQERGYNGFSYADISEAIGIRKASIHYHFATKNDLAQAILNRYQKDFSENLNAINTKFQKPLEKIKAYFALYRATLESNSKLCLCSMMAAEIHSFPSEIRQQINSFFENNANWLDPILEEGKNNGEFRFSNRTNDQAKILVAFVQGAQLLAKSTGEIDYYDLLVRNYIKDLKQ
ncbi:TetR/AcrR family transcriptional regulator [Paenibacillus sp. KACC 21273]|uniref:TetR/AcrR family transcriptional regulator n=1 Tax=Paenibacillus sp. KACC 21273 TaxID=3025665 RepID=UPI002366ABD9|nr:TetR/AcrR family transcriptional regulator [Paenibacillus sp. KACC 21273]WDF48860.1 TetR/AcrR family transcriptional regulator [Paenibacillus sp. KACC 21273]